jgi:3-oxoacyl-[acyl-carrier protein] reductase
VNDESAGVGAGVDLRETIMDLGVSNRVYILTGASRGLGYAVAEQLVAEGARVVVSSRNAESVHDAVERLGPDRAEGVAADNAVADTPGRLVQSARTRFGRLDGVLISVGGPPAATAMAATPEQWRQSFESVFLGAVSLATAVAAELDDGGSILFVLSTSVREPIPGLAVSNGLRPGLAMIAKNLSEELGPRGIRVNGIMPGRIETQRIRELDAHSPDPVAAKSLQESYIPLRRSGQPEEFGRVGAFLLSPSASYVSGAMVPVDGGLTRAL